LAAAFGLTNAEAFARGTHPLGFHTRYLAEGSVNRFFRTRIAAFNPDSGVIVESIGAARAQIVVERAMYTSPDGVTWTAGTNLLATDCRSWADAYQRGRRPRIHSSTRARRGEPGVMRATSRPSTCRTSRRRPVRSASRASRSGVLGSHRGPRGASSGSSRAVRAMNGLLAERAISARGK
jgi:hypothetical protein